MARKKLNKAQCDLVALLVFILIVSVLSAMLGVHEWLVNLFHITQHWLEEVFIIVPLALLGLLVYTYRRHREAVCTLQEKEKAEQKCDHLDKELELLKNKYFQVKGRVKAHKDSEESMKEQVAEMKKLTKMSVDREKRMIELKHELEAIKKSCPGTKKKNNHK